MKKIFFFIIFLAVFFFGYYYLQGNKLEFLKENLKKGRENKQILTSASSSLTEENKGGFYLEIISPKDKEISNTSNLVIKGKTIPFAQVFINDKETKADNKGNFSLNYLLDEGENEIIIVANDDLGNYAEKNLKVQLQTLK